MPISHKQSDRADKSENLTQRGDYERYRREGLGHTKKPNQQQRPIFYSGGGQWTHPSDNDLFILPAFRKYYRIYLKLCYILSKPLINFQIVFAKNLIFGDEHHGVREFFYNLYRNLLKFCSGIYVGVFYKMTKNLRSRIN